MLGDTNLMLAIIVGVTLICGAVMWWAGGGSGKK
jgi:hypothetical protein